MAARGYEFYFRIQLDISGVSAPPVGMQYFVHHIDPDETPGKRFLGLVLYLLNPDKISSVYLYSECYSNKAYKILLKRSVIVL